MLHWQREHIRKNLTGLIKSTKLNAILQAYLLSEDVLNDADVNKLEAIQQTKGTLEGSAELWGILQTRKNAYEKMTRALIECEQSGAAGILEEGIWNHGFIYTKVMIHGKLMELGEILKINIELQKDLADIISKSQEGIKYFVTGNNILELVKNTIPPPRPYYIERLISNNIKINLNIFRIECNDVFVFKEIDRIMLTELARPNSTSSSSNQLLKITSKFILLENEVDWEDMLKICKQPMHLIKVEDGSYILEETTGDSSVIREYFAPENLGESVFISEDELLDKIQKVNYCNNICICDTPGMGKSLLLESLAGKVLQRYPDRIVAFIPLSKFIYNEQSSSKPVDNSLKQVINYFSPTKLGRIILEKAVTKEIIRFELFFDGFDEIPLEFLDLACNFFKNLIQFSKQIRVYIASRPQHQRELEKILKVISYKIRPFSPKNQTDFLALFWGLKFPKNEYARLEIFASECVKQIKHQITSDERDIMGIPLQCYLLGEVYLNEARLFSDPLRKNIDKSALKSIDTVFKMYDNFIQSKTFSICETDRNEFIEYHVFKALQLICPEITDFLQFPNEINSDKYLSAGILEARNETDSTTSCNFVHRTFGEYFVGMFCADVFTGNKRYHGFKCTDENKMNDLIFARFLDSRKGQCHYLFENVEVFTLHYPVVSFFLNAHLGTLENININPCHVNKLMDYFTHEKVYNFIFPCLQLNYLYLFRLIISALQNFDSVSAKSYKKYFRKRSICIESGYESFVATSPLCVFLSEASKSLKLECILKFFEVICNFVEITLSDICRKMPKILANPLTEGCKNADYDLVEYFIDKISLEHAKLMSKAISSSYYSKDDFVEKKIKVCQLLLTKCSTLSFDEINESEVISRNWIHLEIIKFLYKQGVNFCGEGYDGCKISIIVLARKYMSSNEYHELVETFIEDQGLPLVLSANQSKAYFPLHKILNPGYNRNVKLKACTLKMLLSISKTNVNQVDYVKCNLLHAAVIGDESTEIFEELINRGVDYRAKGDLGLGVLHLAAFFGNLSTVGFFVSKGLPVNDPDPGGDLPLHLARTSDVAIYLIEQGSDLIRTNIFGYTICHTAVLKMLPKDFINFYEYITKYKDATKLFNIKSKAGRTPLHEYICLKGLHYSSDVLNILMSIPATDINTTDELGNNLILSAVHNNFDHKLIEILVKYGCSYKQINNKSWNALEMAVVKKNLETANYLLSLGLTMNTGYPSWNTLLSLAFSQSEMIKLLIRKGAKLTTSDGLNVSYFILEEAAEKVVSAKDFHDLVLFLFEQENVADIGGIQSLWNSLHTRFSKCLKTSEETLHFFIEHVKKRDKNVSKFTTEIFRLAILNRHSSVNILKTLVENGADYKLVNEQGWSMLHQAIDKGNPDTVEYLLSLGLSPNESNKKEIAATSFVNFDKANYKALEIIKCLLKYGTDMTQTDNNGNNIVHKAASKMTEIDFHKLTTTLLQTDKTINLLTAKNSLKQTPLLIQLLNRKAGTNEYTIKPILRLSGINVNAEDSEGFNYFLAAVKGHKSIAVLQKLVKWGCDYNATNLVGNTALHILMNERYDELKHFNSEGRVETIRYLISLGINPSRTNKDGKTPLNMVQRTPQSSRNESKSYISKNSYTYFIITQTQIIEILKSAINSNSKNLNS